MQAKQLIPLAVAAVTLGAAALAVQARDLTVVSWGGAYQDGQKEVFFKPFNATGTKLLDEAWDGGLGVLRTKIKGGNNTWDVVQVEADELEVGCDEGLYEKLDVAKIGGANRYLPGHGACVRRRRDHLQPGAGLRRRQVEGRAERLGRLLRHGQDSRQARGAQRRQVEPRDRADRRRRQGRRRLQGAAPRRPASSVRSRSSTRSRRTSSSGRAARSRRRCWPPATWS